MAYDFVEHIDRVVDTLKRVGDFRRVPRSLNEANDDAFVGG
jgi:hypothetical protein